MVYDLISTVGIVLGTSDQASHVFRDRPRPKPMSMPMPIPMLRKERFEFEMKSGDRESKRKKGGRVVLNG